MKIRIFTPIGMIEYEVLDSDIKKYNINEYCEEIMECGR